MIKLFDFVTAINLTKKDLLADRDNESVYVPYIINKSLSLSPDTLFYANEMNRYHNIPKVWQFNFLRHSVPKKKRFSPWPTKIKIHPDIELIKTFYNLNTKNANDALKLLSAEQILIIKQTQETGGKQ